MFVTNNNYLGKNNEFKPCEAHRNWARKSKSKFEGKSIFVAHFMETPLLLFI